MRVRLLGPVDVEVDGAPRPVRGLRRKAVLAVLALHAGEIVSTDRLVDVVWGERAPSTVVNTLQHHVAYLRQILEGRDSILTRPPGYLLNLGTDCTDAATAERLIRQGTREPDPAARLPHLGAALALWRGRPLADVVGLRWLDEQAERLGQLWLRGTRALVEARLAVGEHELVVPDLERLSREYPFDEQLHAQLMLALYRTGRQADALAAFHRLRDGLREDLGIDPGQSLRELEAAILRQDPVLDLRPPAGTPPAQVPSLQVVSAQVPPAQVPPAQVPPAQLPPAVPAFVGRAGELAALDALLAGQHRPGRAAMGPETVVISAVSGTAGVGKTALAVYWAHRAAARFPDGQLYVNLRGFDPGGAVLDPSEAVRELLDAFGVPAGRIPADLAARTALYRSTLAGKRVLIVLDNARDDAQVRPLLPGSPGSLVIVTSRNQLTSLVATAGAHPLTLDLLDQGEARDLLAGRLGPDRVAGAPDAVQTIIAGCARLPLALAIAAARAATRPDFPLAALAAQLREATGALDALDGGDSTADVRAVFSWSYRACSPAAARLFRLLGLHPGPDLGAAAAASLGGLPLRRARVLLAELTRAHLLVERASGRYTFHDLLRAYAAEVAHREETADDRDAARHRLLDHYLHSGHAAARLLEPYADPIALMPPRPGVILGLPGTAQDALSWFTTEHGALLASVGLAAGAGFDRHAWQLAWTMTTYLARRGHWEDQEVAQNAGLAAARRLGNTIGQAHALHGLAFAHARSGRFQEARSQYRHALRQFERAGDRMNQAHIHLRLGWLSTRSQRPAEALGHVLQALDLYRAVGHTAVLGRVLNDIGWCYAQLGDYAQAVVYCQRALTANQELGERNWEAGTWDSLGYAHRGLGDHRRAAECYRHAIDLYRQLGDRYNEADTLANLGDTLEVAGEPGAAREARQEALDILDGLSHPDAGPIRAKLGGETPRGTGRAAGAIPERRNGAAADAAGTVDPGAVESGAAQPGGAVASAR